MTERQTHDKTTVSCHECGKTIPSIPSWLATVKVKFECEECRQKAAGRPVGAGVEPVVAEEPEPLVPGLDGLEDEVPEDMDDSLESDDIDMDETMLDADLDAESDITD